MTTKTRRTIFYLLVVLFFIIGFFIIGYSQGARLDFKTMKFVQTGGIYIQSFPTDSDIKLDDKNIDNKTGLLQAGTFIKNLLPENYYIEVFKTGFSNWEKQTEVAASSVSVFDKIVLIPLDKSEKLGAGENLYVAQEKLIIKNKTGLSYRGEKILGDEIVATMNNGTFISRNSINNTYYLNDFSNLKSPINLSSLFNTTRESKLNLDAPADIVRVVALPQDDKKLVIKTSRSLYSLNLDNSDIQRLSSDVLDFSTENGLSWLEPEKIINYNTLLQSKEEFPLDYKIDESLKFESSPSSNSFAILEKNGKLKLFIKNSNEIIDLSESAEDFTISPDSSWIAFSETNGDVYFYNPEKEKYILLDKDPDERVKNISWYRDSYHIFLEKSGNLIFQEVDDILPQNPVILGKSNKYFYDKNNQIYFIFESELFKLQIGQ